MKTGAALCIIGLCAGCSGSHELPRGGSLQEFQDYYADTKWYWSDVRALPTNISGYRPVDLRQGSQVHLVSDDEKRIMRYTEMEQRTGMKTFYGQGVLGAIDGMDGPLFGVVGNSNMFIGFFDHRLMRLEVVRWGEDPARMKRDVIALGREVLSVDQNSRKQNSVKPDAAPEPPPAAPIQKAPEAVNPKPESKKQKVES